MIVKIKTFSGKKPTKVTASHRGGRGASGEESRHEAVVTEVWAEVVEAKNDAAHPEEEMEAERTEVLHNAMREETMICAICARYYMERYMNIISADEVLAFRGSQAEHLRHCDLSELLITTGFFIHSHNATKLHASFSPPCQCHSRPERPRAGLRVAASSALMASGREASAC